MKLAREGSAASYTSEGQPSGPSERSISSLRCDDGSSVSGDWIDSAGAWGHGVTISVGGAAVALALSALLASFKRTGLATAMLTIHIFAFVVGASILFVRRDLAFRWAVIAPATSTALTGVVAMNICGPAGRTLTWT